MAYEFLTGLFGTNEDGTGKALTADELVKAIEANKSLKIVDLSAGGYVSKDKYDAQTTKLDGITSQLADANKTIKGYTDMDIDGIKASAADWEQKYKTDTADLNQKIADQENDFATRTFLNGYQYSDDLAKEAIEARFRKQGFKRGETGEFEGAVAWMDELKKSNPNAFKTDPVQNPVPQQSPNAPLFAPGNGGKAPENAGRKMTLTEIMKYANENPGANIDALLDQM